MFIAGKIVGALFLPPGIIFLFLCAGLAFLLAGRRRTGTGVMLASTILLYLLSTGPIADLLLRPLEDRYPPIATSDQGTKVVVLGGGSVESSPEYGGKATLIDSGARRAAYGAELALARGLPLVYSGGTPLRGAGAESEASAARRFLVGLGFPAGRIVLEEASRDTAGNAEGLARMADSGRLILVTSAFHMPRSVLSFRKVGLDVLPAATDYRSHRGAYRLMHFLPSAGALENSALALHEYLGLLYYSVR